MLKSLFKIQNVVNPGLLLHVTLRDHVHMTSAQRGEGGFKNWPILRTDKTDRLREMRTRGGGV